MTRPTRIVAGTTALILAASLTGCATSDSPPSSHVYAYPTKGQSAQQQAQDTNECQTWAQQQTGYSPGTDAAKGAGIGLAIGALGGAAAGAAIGAAAGSPGTGAAVGAAAGGIGGAAYGGTSQYGKGQGAYDQAFSACMNGRGYSTGK